MGVKGLYSHLKPFRKRIQPLAQNIAPLRIGIDAMSFLYRYKEYYKEGLPWIEQLKQRGHTLLFVFDGKPPASKEVEVKERRDARTSAADQAKAIRDYLSTGSPDPKEKQVLEFSIARLEHQAWHLTREIRHEIQDRLTEVGIPFVKAKHEADDVLVDLSHHKKIDVIMSTDMDYLLAGAPRLWIPLGYTCEDTVEEIILEEILFHESLTAEAFRDAGILCGVEPLRGRPTVIPKTAITWLRHYGSLESIAARKKEYAFLLEDGLLEKTRAHFGAAPTHLERIREDTLEKNHEFLLSL